MLNLKQLEDNLDKALSTETSETLTTYLKNKRTMNKTKSKLPKSNSLYLIIRGEKSEHHKAPFTPILLCSRRHTAEWEAGDTQDGSTVLITNPHSECGLWLLSKYKGYNIDYGTTYRNLKLFDGTFVDDITNDNYVDELLKKAVWWSDCEVPKRLLDKSINFPSNNWTKNRILEDDGLCLLSHSKQVKHEERLEKYDLPEWLTLENE